MHKYVGPRKPKGAFRPDREGNPVQVEKRFSVPGVPLRDMNDDEFEEHVAAGRIDPDGPSGAYWKFTKGKPEPEPEAVEGAGSGGTD